MVAAGAACAFGTKEDKPAEGCYDHDLCKDDAAFFGRFSLDMAM